MIKPVVIWSNNLGAATLTINLVYHSRTKHVEIDVHFVRDKVASREIQVRYVPTFEQTAYSLTKALPTSRVKFLRDQLGLIRIPPSLSGGVKAP